MNRELFLLEKLEKELNLKQLQIKSLLTITQAINDNVSTEGLFNMYKSFLSWEMGIEKMALFIIQDDGWHCTTFIHFEEEKANEIIPILLQHKRLHTIKDGEHKVLEGFNIIIPVFHKDIPIAYAIIGGIKEKEDLYNKIQFITTITNIIAVAIENKRLFKKQIEQERYQREMELASQVQQLLIPEFLPSEKEFALSKIYKPHFNIGGDYLDFIRFDEKRFAFCIADISGKGVGAALLMANFQAITQSLIFQYRDLETFVFALNQSVYRITKSDKYITLFVAEVDLSKKTLRYVNAGHYPPVIKINNALKRLESSCSFIGAFEKLPEIKEECIHLENDTMILCFTDGLIDLKNNKDEFFGDEAIEKFLDENSDLHPEKFNEKLLKEINDFRGELEINDDIAVLTCKIF
ncbi:MAG: serine/threonine-protein phosphatase [Saprospiraceae bacterium]|nr:serine/threonine-protein phosphatase [Saprospiraceae bacterium]MBK6564364.1 serine/threonine-protein phosphatase [Saprospiraceae bacterium]MBK6782533.1 serine/threonine-protein phosphatase [Saprospiraceae bacterium]MBK8372006.1 serine/threonine-protein phosphatase [Saprospiraceae bacterium]MBK8547274.1 serine/threonine-protein phosphatase [Saprospiraceae bacterium]